MPHGGYHGKVVGLGSKPSSRQPGIEQSNTSKSKNTPQQKKDKGIMARKNAYQSMANAGIKSLSGDVTGDKKGVDAKVKQVMSGMTNTSQGPRSGKYFDPNATADDILDEQIKETKPPEKVTEKTKYKPSILSKTRDLSTKAGVPVVFSQFAYSLMGRNKQNVPLKIDNFSKDEIRYIKNKALERLLNINNGSLPVDSNGNVKATEPVVVRYYTGNPLNIFSRSTLAERSVGGTLGNATAYVNNNGELIITDYYDWQTGVNIINPDTGNYPQTVTEWSSTVAKLASDYATYSGEKSMEAEARKLDLKDFKDEEIDLSVRVKSDAYEFSQLLMDSAESLANIIGPKKYEQNSIFEVPEEKRTILNLGKIQ